MNTLTVRKTKLLFSLIILAAYLVTIPGYSGGNAYAQEIPPGTAGPEQTQPTYIEVIDESFSIAHYTRADGTPISAYIINGPPHPRPEYEAEWAATSGPTATATILPDFPSYSWVFGCSAVSGSMIAAYYDRGAYTNMYSGPTNGGLMPLSDTSWVTWSDGYDTYPNNPLVASHMGVDGLATRGSIDDYWVQVDSILADPYITNGWVQHTWVSAIGDFMKTSQSNIGNVDGETTFYNLVGSGEKYTCSDMVVDGYDDEDGTYGRKLFYEARGYTVTDCYNQNTDNQVPGGFSLANFQAEINAGHPVLLNVYGHSMVGYGYDGSTIYIRDTWDNDPSSTHTMTWGGTYDGRVLLSVSVVHLSPATPPQVKRASLPMILKTRASAHAPMDILLSNSSIAENQPVNTLVGTFSTVDADAGDTFTYSLVSGAGDSGNGSFNILGNQLLSSAVFDYETQNSYSIRVRTTDRFGMFYEKTFTITITFVSSSPIINGDFEMGNEGWIEYSSNGFLLIVTDNYTEPIYAHSGEWLAWLGGYNNEISDLSQAVTVPAGTSVLHYWYIIESGDYCGYDFFYILVNGAPVFMQDLCMDTQTNDWVEGALNLSAYANATITLTFEVTTDIYTLSNVFLDDIFFSSTLATQPGVSQPEEMDLDALDKAR